MKLIHIFSLITALVISPLQAGELTLLDAWHRALAHDPGYQAARKEKEAGDEEKHLGRAELLPKISASYQHNPRNWQKRTLASPAAGGQNITTTHQDYASHTGSVTLVQPLIDYGAFARYQAAQAQTLMSDERYRGKLQELAGRVVNAYLQVAYQQECLRLAALKKAAFYQRLLMNKKLFRAGEETTTSIAESEARYALAIAEEIELNNDLDAARRELEAITGAPIDVGIIAVRLPEKFTPLPIKMRTFEQWREIALDKNPMLLAARQNVATKRHEIEQYRAGHLPVIQLYASHSLNDSGSDNTVHQKYRTSSVGVKVNMSVYSGGNVAALTRQAVARYEQEKFLLDAQVQSTLNSLHKFYNQQASSRAKINACILAVEYAKKQIIATQKSVITGQRINIDVLNAEQLFYSAQTDLANEKINYINSWTGLLISSGMLTTDDLTTLTNHLKQEKNTFIN